MKWLKPEEVLPECLPGYFVLTRTDDEGIPRGVIEIDKNGTIFWEKLESQEVDTLDPECRLYGPINKWSKENDQ